jgi:hypothetical protein
VQPGSETGCYEWDFSPLLLEGIEAGKGILYIWGWATYNDVFPGTAKHVTRFAVRLLIGGNPLDSVRCTFTFVPLPRYNCSDEECDRQGYPADWKPRQITPRELEAEMRTWH